MIPSASELLPSLAAGKSRFIRQAIFPPVELRLSNYRQHAFEEHLHDSFSIGLVLQGETHFNYWNQLLSARAGDLVLLNPGEPHACNPQGEQGVSYAMLYVEPCWLRQKMAEVLEVEGNSAAGLVWAREFLFSEPVIQDAALQSALIGFCDAYASQTASRLEIESLACAWVKQLVQRLAGGHWAGSPQPQPSPAALQLVKEYLEQHPESPVSLTDLAALCGLSAYHLLRAFRGRYGMPPHAYQIQQRINLARRLLRSQPSIAQVAAETGFADQSHFTRTFKALVGVTPRQYQGQLAP